MTYPLHELNDDFDWISHKGPFNFLTAEQGAAYDRDGFFLVRDALTRDEIAAITAAVDPLEQEFEDILRTQENGERFISKVDSITFAPHFVTKSPEVKAFARHPVLARIARDLLGDNVRLYWDQAVYKKPGNPRPFPYHQDNGYNFVEPQIYLTCWIPLVDVDEENGCPWVVPGLHRLGTLTHKTVALGYELFVDHPEEVAIPAKAGDIVVFSSLTPHKTGPNLTDETRKAYILQYAPDGIHVKQTRDDPGVPQTAEDRHFFVVKDGNFV